MIAVVFFTIAPAEENIFKKNRLVCKNTALGCLILTTNLFPYEDDIKFEFVVKTEDVDLLNCSGEITFFEYEDQEKNRRIRRYKKIFMFTNTTEEAGEKIHFISPGSPVVIKQDYFPEYNFLLSENILERKHLSSEERLDNPYDFLAKMFPDDIFAFISLANIKNQYKSVPDKNVEATTHPVFEINFEKCTTKYNSDT